MSSATLNPIAAAPSTDEAVRAELWISFVSLMRSHLGALQTSGKLAKATLLEDTPTSLRVNDLSRALTLKVEMLSGDGQWQVSRMGKAIHTGRWCLNPNATVVIDNDAVEDMELAVEAFARKLWATAVDAETAERN